jgi:Spy/CpxP family protein refolding chaperone
MKLLNKFLIAVAALAFANCLRPLPAHAQPHPGFRGPRAGMMGEGAGMTLPLLLRGANLTADQKTQVQQITANHRAAFQSLFSQLRTVQDQISSTLLSTEAVSESDLAPQLQQVSTLRSQLAAEGLRVALEIRNILTPDQLAKAAQLKTQMQSLQSQMKSLMAPQPGTQQ